MTCRATAHWLAVDTLRCTQLGASNELDFGIGSLTVAGQRPREPGADLELERELGRRWRRGRPPQRADPTTLDVQRRRRLRRASSRRPPRSQRHRTPVRSRRLPARPAPGSRRRRARSAVGRTPPRPATTSHDPVHRAQTADESTRTTCRRRVAGRPQRWPAAQPTRPPASAPVHTTTRRRRRGSSALGRCRRRRRTR